MHPAVEAGNLNNWATREPERSFFVVLGLAVMGSCKSGSRVHVFLDLFLVGCAQQSWSTYELSQRAWALASGSLKSESEVVQSCLTLCGPMDYSLPGHSIHGIFQARVLE